MHWAMCKPLFISGLLLLAACLSGPLSAQPQDANAPDAARILAASDQARGGGLPGIVWQVEVATVMGDNDRDSMSLEVKSNGNNNLMEILTPAKARGRKILMRNNNMWFSSPSVSKPVPISPRQRLTGQASYGDVAATNYVDDYRAELLGTDSIEGNSCYLLSLTAANNNVTYDKIKYWVSQASGLGVKAEFYTVSGKLIKTAQFLYDNTIRHDDRTIPFVSEMRIVDTLAGDSVTTLTYSSIETRPLSGRDFKLH
jgi:hypothetical protein